MRSATVTCDDCGATWDAATAGFCSRCGALLDTPVAPIGRTRPGDAPTEYRRSSDRPASRVTAIAGLLGSVAVIVTAALLASDANQLMGDLDVDLPPPSTATPRLSSADRADEVTAAAGPSARPICNGPDGKYNCIVWERAWAVGDLDDRGGRSPVPATSSGLAVVGRGPVVLWPGDDRASGVTEVGNAGHERIRIVDPTSGEITAEMPIEPPYDEDDAFLEPQGDVVVLRDRVRLHVIDVAGETQRNMMTNGRWLASQALLPDVALERFRQEQAGGEGPGTTLVARTLADGEERWRRPLPGVAWDHAVRTQRIEEGLLVSPCCRDGRPVATAVLDHDNGDVRWSVEDGTDVWGSWDGMALFVAGSRDGTRSPSSLDIVVRDAATGEIRWSTDDLDLGPIERVHDLGPLLLITDGSGMTALDRRDGTVRWDNPHLTGASPADQVDGSSDRSPSVDPMIVQTREGRLHRIDDGTGDILWSYQPTTSRWTRALTHGDHVFVYGEPGITLLDAATGGELLSVEAAEHVVDFDHLVMSAPGRLFRVSLENPSAVAAEDPGGAVNEAS